MIKKTVASACAVFCLAVFLAQPASGTEFSGGARIGLNLSSIIGDTVTIMVPRFGLNGEIFACEWINESFGLQEELGIGSRGEAWKSSDSIDWGVYDRFAGNFTYLDVPILAKWRFLQRENVRPVLYGGFTIGFPLVAEFEYLGNTSDLLQRTQPVDFGLTAGVSMEIKQGNAIIPIDFRYTWGATSFLKNPDYPVQLHHSVFSLSAGFGWIFNMAKKGEF